MNRLPTSAPTYPPPKITHPSLPQGKEQVTLPIVISPHLTSPEGEGQMPCRLNVIGLSQNKTNLHPPVYDSNRVTCISPTGENERGLK